MSTFLAEPAVNDLLTAETPLFIVFNTASGSRDAERSRRTMQDILTAEGRTHTFLPVDDPRRLREIARHAASAAAQRQGAIVVAGGDGTINCVAAAALETGRPFGIVPQGTFNWSSRAHGIPLDTAEATRALLHARLEPMQVGVINDRIFLVNASLGLYPQLLQEREVYKRRYGRRRSVALWAGLGTLLRAHRRLTLEIEHDREREVVQTPTLFVGNNALQLEQVGLPPRDGSEALRLSAVLLKPTGTLSLLRLALRGTLGRLGEDDHVRDFRFASMTVRPRRGFGLAPLKVATDGEIHWMRPPLRFSVAPQPLLLMVPARGLA